jgi:hypothetical protein
MPQPPGMNPMTTKSENCLIVVSLRGLMMDYFTMVQIVIQITTASRYGSFEFEYQDTGYLFTFIDTSVRDRVALADRSKISAYVFIGGINLSKAATEQRLSASIQGKP